VIQLTPYKDTGLFQSGAEFYAPLSLFTGYNPDASNYALDITRSFDDQGTYYGDIRYEPPGQQAGSGSLYFIATSTLGIANPGEDWISQVKANYTDPVTGKQYVDLGSHPFTAVQSINVSRFSNLELGAMAVFSAGAIAAAAGAAAAASEGTAAAGEATTAGVTTAGDLPAIDLSANAAPEIGSVDLTTGASSSIAPVQSVAVDAAASSPSTLGQVAGAVKSAISAASTVSGLVRLVNPPKPAMRPVAPPRSPAVPSPVTAAAPACNVCGVGRALLAIAPLAALAFS